MRNLSQLLQTSAESRDFQWEDEFLTQLASTKVHVLSPDPQTGPDQWPYLMVGTDQAQAPEDSAEETQKILAWLAERGIGLVVNPTKEYPDFVLSYGMVWNFRETGRFIDRRQTLGSDASQDEVSYTQETLKNAGPPTEQYLPAYVRNILRQFFRDQGILQIKILVMSTDNVNYDLAISLESLKNPPAHEHAGIAEAISWFLPPHYNIVLISEKGLPPFSVL